MPGWMQAVAAANPVNWALDAPGPSWRARPTGAPCSYGVAGWSLLAGVMVWLSTLTFRGYQRTV